MDKYDELIQYLGEQFDAADQRSNERETQNKNEHVELMKQFGNLTTAVDSYIKKADTYFQEMTVLMHKVQRLEKWAEQVADKVGINIEF